MAPKKATTKKTTAKKVPVKKMTAEKAVQKKEAAQKASPRFDAKVYDVSGKESGSVSLPERVFGLAWNADLMYEVVRSMQSNARANTAHTKGRGEVRGGGRKPWRQKGTGRARHGSRRSPIWRGGGITFGPRNERNYTKKINRKVRARALGIALSRKFAEGEVIFVDGLRFAAPKAKDARAALVALGGTAGHESLKNKRKNAALIVLSARDESIEKSFQNFGNVYVTQAKDLNPVDLLTFKYAIVTDPAASLETLEKRVVGTAKA